MFSYIDIALKGSGQNILIRFIDINISRKICISIPEIIPFARFKYALSLYISYMINSIKYINRTEKMLCPNVWLSKFIFEKFKYIIIVSISGNKRPIKKAGKNHFSFESLFLISIAI